MVLKLIDATQAKPGVNILIENDAYTVKSNDISKTGKHGASKCRIEAIGIFSDKKKVLAVAGSERFEVPMIEKRRGQVLSVGADSVNIMDMESYETLDLPFHDDVKDMIGVEKQVEYWDIEGKKMVMRVL